MHVCAAGAWRGHRDAGQVGGRTCAEQFSNLKQAGYLWPTQPANPHGARFMLPLGPLHDASELARVCLCRHTTSWHACWHARTQASCGSSCPQAAWS